MATQTRYATSSYQNTSFINPSGAYNAPDNTYCTWNTTTRNGTGNVGFGIAPFDIPADSIINTVTLYMEYKATYASVTLGIGMQMYNSASARGTVATFTTHSGTDADVSSTTTGTWTVADLNGSAVRALINGSRNNTANPSNVGVDSVWVIVDYNAPAFVYNLKQGANQINAVYVGSSNSSAVYLGSNKIFG